MNSPDISLLLQDKKTEGNEDDELSLATGNSRFLVIIFSTCNAGRCKLKSILRHRKDAATQAPC